MTYNSPPSDFGWAETSYHRNPEDKEISTPTMDALVKSGVELNRHYVHMMCTPSRASFYSGRLPVHVLTQLAGPCDENGAIPRNMTGIAQVLKRGGYATHQVGKWCEINVSAANRFISLSLTHALRLSLPLYYGHTIGMRAW